MDKPQFNINILKHYSEIHILSSGTLNWKHLKTKSLGYGQCTFENEARNLIVAAVPNILINKSGQATHFCLTNGINEIAICGRLVIPVDITATDTFTVMPFNLSFATIKEKKNA